MAKKHRVKQNIFRDVGFNSEEAGNLKLRAMLMTEVEKHMRTNQLTQKQAAVCFGVTQPRMSDLVRGKIGLFSVDTLIAMLSHAGLVVDVKVKRSAA